MGENLIEIILIEDNVYDAKLTIRALTKSNLSNKILHLKDGEEALNYFFSENYNQNPKLILLDIKMPKVSGIDVLRKLKSDEKLKVIPIVILTSSNEDRDIVEAYQLKVNAYIVKPVNYESLMKAVQEIGLYWLIVNQPPK